MGLNEILTNEKMSAGKKIKKIAEVVTTARAAYGNTKMKISEPEVNTTEGTQDLSMVSDESKVALAVSEVNRIKSIAVQVTKSNEGVVLDRKIEELIAVSPLLANITKTVESQYL